MKKKLILMACLIASSQIFAEKNWHAEIVTNVDVVKVNDVFGDTEAELFSGDLIDDDTKISFGYENDIFEAGFEITPVFFWADEDLNPEGTIDAKNAFTTLFAGIKFGSVAKVRAGIYENRTEDYVENFKLNNYIDELEYGFVLADLESNVESDLINGPVLLDLYLGNVIFQASPLTSIFYGDEKSGGVQLRGIAALDVVDLSANYSFYLDNSNSINQFSILGKINVVENLPIALGFSLYNNADNSDENMYGLDLRLEKDFGILGAGLHNNLTLLKDQTVLTNTLGVVVPVAETVSVNLEVVNGINFNDDQMAGRFVAYPYVSYSPVEEAVFKLGLQLEVSWADESSSTFTVPMSVEVSY